MNKQQMEAKLDQLIAERDAGRREAQNEIDALMEQIERRAFADQAFQAAQSEAAWKRACVNTALWA